VLYAYLLERAGTPGWIAALLFAIACGLRLARFNVLDDDMERQAWQAEYFVGVPAPAGAAIVLLPAYLGFIGVDTERPLVYCACIFTVLVALLMISRLPVYSGKTIGKRISTDRVVPLIFVLVLYVLLLASYPWQTLSISVIAYLAFLPLSARAYSRQARLEAVRRAEAARPTD
jgi:CDP-diacylglycerol--serine O-phosphatidyltransferase